MPKKKKTDENRPKVDASNVMGLRAAVVEQPITDTLELNYMPYAMSVIVSRAIPEIDGFKPSHRKLLYTMYKMGLLTGARTKSANIVGQTMRLNPHGDAAIYDTMVRLSRGYGALLTPFVDSKGNFGKSYSRDMSCAAPRYTEAKLTAICAELFRDIDSDTVDFVDNYDSTMKEPTLLPTTFPNILVSANSGIAVGMASQFCGFNLKEVCETTIAYLKNPDCDLTETLLAPDFPTGGELICDPAALKEIYDTGRGSVRVRAKYRYVKEENLIEIYEIPYSTTVEAILDKVAELIKAGRAKEIADMRDETDLSGLKLAIDLKRGTDPDKLMTKLYKLTPLEDAFACNFNVLIAGTPKVLGVRQILEEWTAWRTESVRRRIYFVLKKKQDKLHLLKGLKRILLDIDKAIQIIRETEEEAEVIPNLMIGFGIDQIQAEYVAEIKLRNINKEYILKRVNETAALQDEIEDLEDTLNSPRRVKQILADELTEAAKKYGEPRRTSIVYSHEVETYVEEDGAEDYPVHVFLSRRGISRRSPPPPCGWRRSRSTRRGRPCPGIREHQQRGDHVLHGPVPGVQDPSQRVRRHQGQRPGRLPAGKALHGRRGERGVRRAAGAGLRRRAAVLLRKRQGRPGGPDCLPDHLQPPEAHRGLLRQGAPGLHPEAGRGRRAGGVLQRAAVPDLPHRPPGPQDHPHHPGGGGDEPEAQVPPGDGEAPGGDGHHQPQPLPGAEHPRRRRSGAGGGRRGAAAGPAERTEGGDLT